MEVLGLSGIKSMRIISEVLSIFISFSLKFKHAIKSVRHSINKADLKSSQVWFKSKKFFITKNSKVNQLGLKLLVYIRNSWEAY